jgi:hypothetical protein
MFQENYILFLFKILIFNFFNFQVQRDPCIAVVDDGYAVALPGLKCFKGKKEKEIFSFIF